VVGRGRLADLDHGRDGCWRSVFWLLKTPRVKQWEIIADNLSNAGWSWGCVSVIDCNRRTIWIADAHRDDGKRFVVHAEEKLSAFVELESAVNHPDGDGAPTAAEGVGDAGRPECDCSFSALG
jgi:hypothetical protein